MSLGIRELSTGELSLDSVLDASPDRNYIWEGPLGDVVQFPAIFDSESIKLGKRNVSLFDYPKLGRRHLGDVRRVRIPVSP